MNTQINKPITKLKLGAIINKIQLDLNGIIISLNTNFKPSANAWSDPQKPVTFGPRRR
jgi:hypothetical protein